MRPPSREEVHAAQPHLVLLKSKLRQRKTGYGGGYGGAQVPAAAFPSAYGG
eukprot:CAMPEP_0177165764 /NCGR_PEP_ID=MMETSP0367-20130122/7679_1 /TAXON_ID=447022 ORGANISM="Scrippsiella hangoei-like, Strain SHHI-4" /NCGR_SAMPLE_ID=MMETSP0367 /ASSEMBLY_ACC=CAM_ASM_000362 /LENGTH=50 /DNA_ID=CAMNT_0018611797 /DNA_START=130 /DNA_END=279 /DNA_ORIENTATION=+